eukprot:GFYU01019347.1.p1 GENE.GFYU01019347.1~~GFYU01019347.1.p1  ORF type:complete len:143 (-),score=31.65 GFYU01019347.1:65-493(-)
MGLGLDVQERRRRQRKFAQRMLSGVFVGLGGWCLVCPGQVETLAFNPEYQINNDTSRLLIACFGSQAILNGIQLWTSTLTKTFYLAFGVATLPFFGFNYYFCLMKPMMSKWMLLDVLGNITICSICAHGYLTMDEENEEKEE